MTFTHPKTLFCSSFLAFFITGCASVPVEQGPPMEAVWNKGLEGERNSTEVLQEGLALDPMEAGGLPGYPIVKMPTVLPIWERGSKVSDFIKTDGRWIYEIVDPGGFAD